MAARRPNHPTSWGLGLGLTRKLQVAYSCSLAFMIRKWLKGIKNRMTKDRRAAFTTKVVKKTRKKDGSVAVSASY